MSLWWRGRLCAFDTETTGVDVAKDRIVTATVALVGGGKPNAIHSWIVNPGIPIPPEAAAIHGVTNEFAQTHGEPAERAVRSIFTALSVCISEGLPVIAFNASYDLSLLAAEADRHNVRAWNLDCARVICPLTIDRALDKYRKGSRKLEAVCRHYGVKLENAHDATADAIAAARLAYRMAEKYDLSDLEHLQDQQRTWHREWALGLVAYLRAQGQVRDLPDPDGWPFKIREEQVA